MKRGIDYIGVGVGTAIINERGELFFARRGKQAKNKRSHWEFPGEAVEFSKTLAGALKRELKGE